VNNSMKLTILNETGHTSLELQREGMIEQITDHPTHWIFIDGEMVSREEVNTINWDEVNSVTLTPQVVGGY
tara:strand:- start:3086 stop:3298 length:213 start_codon:yes stop_codon:yes gene_type:complete